MKLAKRKTISQNTTVSEQNSHVKLAGADGAHLHRADVIKIDNFVVQDTRPQSHIQELIKYVAKVVNTHKMNYTQLKYVFRSVRERTNIEVPNDRARKLYDLPTSAELLAFYGVIDDPVHRLIFETLEGTGLRVAELCNLEVKRIDFKANLLFVSEGKGKKDRMTVIGKRLLDKISLYLDGRNNRYLFESNRHSKFSTRRIEQLCQEYLAKSGITKRLTPHTFRHLFFTRLAKAGVSKEFRMILAGHTNEKVQDKYTHLGVGGVKDQVLKVLDGD